MTGFVIQGHIWFSKDEVITFIYLFVRMYNSIF